MHNLFEKTILLLLKYLFWSAQSIFSYLHSYSVVWNMFLFHSLAKEKKILIFQLLQVFCLQHSSASVTLCHHRLGRTLKCDESSPQLLDYTCNSLWKITSLWDLNAVPHRRETISILIYSPFFTVELYWLRKCQVYICLTFKEHVKLFEKIIFKKCAFPGAYLKCSKLSQEKATDSHPPTLSFISQSLFISHLSISAPTACLNKSLTILCCWGYSTSSFQDLLAWAK